MGMLGCDLNNCCPQQFSSRRRVGGKDELLRFGGEGVERCERRDGEYE